MQNIITIVPIIILLVVAWYVFVKGIYYIFAGKNRVSFGEHTRYENLEYTEEEYIYKHKIAALLYLKCGIVIGLFLTILFVLYNFFLGNAHIVLCLLLIFNLIFEQGILETMVNFRFDEERDNK